MINLKYYVCKLFHKKKRVDVWQRQFCFKIKGCENCHNYWFVRIVFNPDKTYHEPVNFTAYHELHSFAWDEIKNKVREKREKGVQ